jgi:hypothetical protein
VYSKQCYEISPKFNLKNMISTYTKDFPWKNWPKFARFWGEKKEKEFPDHQIFF